MSFPVPDMVEIGSAVIYQQLQEEAVLLDMTTQEYYGLDDVGARMWQLLIADGNVELVIDKIATIYGTDAVIIRSDIHRLISDLITANLLKMKT